METVVYIGVICLAVFNAADGAITWTTPTGGRVTKSDVKEGTTGTIYTFVCTAASTPTYTLVSQSVANTFTFTSGSSGGVLSLKAGSKLDYDTAPQHVIEVKALEGTTVSSTATLTLNLVNVNEPPYWTYTYVVSVVESGLTNGATLGTVRFSDQDAGETVSHSFLSGNGAGDLVIGTTSGVISLASGKTLTSSDQYSLVIKAVDSNATPLSASATYILCVDSCNSGAGPLAALSLMALLPMLFTYLP